MVDQGERLLLMKTNLWQIVKSPNLYEGTSTRSSPTKIREKDEQDLGIIITSLEDSYILFFHDAKTRYEARWKILQRMFGAKGKHSKISLKMQLYKLVLVPNETSLISLIE